MCVSDPCGDWTLYGTSCYKYFTSTEQWNSARSQCLSMNADLVTINTLEENSFVLNLTRVSYFWIGLNDISEEGTFVWASGSKSAYRKWKSLEPNDNNKNEDCVEATRQSDWNDVPCNFLMSYVCEKGQHIMYSSTFSSSIYVGT